MSCQSGGGDSGDTEPTGAALALVLPQFYWFPPYFYDSTKLLRQEHDRQSARSPHQLGEPGALSMAINVKPAACGTPYCCNSDALSTLPPSAPSAPPVPADSGAGASLASAISEVSRQPALILQGLAPRMLFGTLLVSTQFFLYTELRELFGVSKDDLTLAWDALALLRS